VERRNLVASKRGLCNST